MRRILPRGPATEPESFAVADASGATVNSAGPSEPHTLGPARRATQHTEHNVSA
jgi:hypothetical protein